MRTSLFTNSQSRTVANGILDMHIFFTSFGRFCGQPGHAGTFDVSFRILSGSGYQLLHLSCECRKSRYSLGAESRKKRYAKHFGYKLATGFYLKKI